MSYLRQYLPSWLKRAVRIVCYWLLDMRDAALGRREPMMPPRMTSLIVGSGDFKKIGKKFLDYFIRYAGLGQEHRVLEIGAGYGRMAVGLTEYLRPPGSYDGIEIVKDAVDWCAREITSRYPHFHFHHADICNSYSNPKGKGRAIEYRLPFSDDSFDLVILISVFTHMTPNDINAYLAETRRVLKSGGACFITYYLLDGFAVNQIHHHRASQPFYHTFDGYLSTSKSTPENTIASPETTIRQFYARHKFTIKEPIYYGSWSGRSKFLTYQDVIVARKT